MALKVGTSWGPRETPDRQVKCCESELRETGGSTSRCLRMGGHEGLLSSETQGREDG